MEIYFIFTNFHFTNSFIRSMIAENADETDMLQLRISTR